MGRQRLSSDADQARLRLPAQARVLLASDMHLGDHDRPTATYFMQACDRRRAACTHLILLGDLFEAWVGDDQTDPVAQDFMVWLARVAASMPVYVMRGNRDFLLNTAPPSAGFSHRTGATMLADPCLLAVGEDHYLLTHGDALCTDDADYQAFRRESRRPGWQAAFLQQALDKRMHDARAMRAQSTLAKSRKAEDITDVNERAAREAVRQAGTTRLVHGHTHRPGRHDYHEARGDEAHVDEARGDEAHVDWQRWVLPDWDAATRRGGFLLLADGLAQELPV